MTKLGKDLIHVLDRVLEIIVIAVIAVVAVRLTSIGQDIDLRLAHVTLLVANTTNDLINQ